jgi:hypothetical protein
MASWYIESEINRRRKLWRGRKSCDWTLSFWIYISDFLLHGTFHIILLWVLPTKGDTSFFDGHDSFLLINRMDKIRSNIITWVWLIRECPTGKAGHFVLINLHSYFCNFFFGIYIYSIKTCVYYYEIIMTQELCTRLYLLS